MSYVLIGQQTLKEYLDNPMGKGSTAISNRNLIRENLDVRYKKLLKDNKDFKHTVYVEGHDYYFHFLIPSESERENTYDVIIHLTEGDDDLKYDNFLYRYKVKFFSNCPSFTYTYAHVAFKYDRLINFLSKKYDKEVIKSAPVVRNPGEILNYEKSVYFACKYLIDNPSLLNKMNLKPIAIKLKREELKAKVRSDAKIEYEIKKENARLSKLKQEQNKSNKSEATNKSNKINGSTKIGDKKPIGNTAKKITPKAKIKPTKSTRKH